MGSEAYQIYESAIKRGRKEFKTLVARGENPYPALLDEDTADQGFAGQEYPGILEIPLERVTGVAQASRQTAFSQSFFPLLPVHTEFGHKWMSLYESQVGEGIRDAIKVYEFRGKYYVEEGNKRTSVLRVVGATMVSAEVIRLLPPRDEKKENVIYYEYLNFWHKTGATEIYFNEEGLFPRLLKAIGLSDEAEVWDEDRKKSFRAAYRRFRAVCERNEERRPTFGCAEAFLACTEIRGYESLVDLTEEALAEQLTLMRDEASALGKQDAVRLILDPSSVPENSLLTRIIIQTPAELRTAFLYDKSPDTSPWTAVHDAGRVRVERRLGSRVRTMPYYDIRIGEDDDEIIEQAIDEGADIVFTTTPRLLGASVRAALRHPDVKVMNCSMNISHPSIRTYYARVYEVKFLIGAIAGALTENNRIGYLADYPIFGVPANINAFAQGAKLTNPKATIQLEWTSVKGRDANEAFRGNGISIISGRDLRFAESGDQSFGLYRDDADGAHWLALPRWHWGKFYTEICTSILDGTWRTDNGADTLNYWWGLSSGLLDVAASASLPDGTYRLLEILRESILSGKLDPLAPLNRDYSLAESVGMIPPEEILRMDYLSDNVIGRIPEIDELIESAKPLVRLQGLDASEVDAL